MAESCRRVHEVANVSENTSAALDFHENHEQTQEIFCCFFSFFPFFLLRRGRNKKAYTRSVPKTGSTTVGAGRALLHNPRGFSRQPMGVQRHQASVQSKSSRSLHLMTSAIFISSARRGWKTQRKVCVCRGREAMFVCVCLLARERACV